MSNFFFKEKNILLIAIIINLSFLAYSINYYINTIQIYGHRGWLPQPFHFLRMDTFMDYYNVNFHALTTDFYKQPFQSVYTFLFRALSDVLIMNECKESFTSLALRDCDKSYLIFFIIIYGINSYILVKIMRDTKYKYLWTIFFMTAFPMLYVFERGNYITISMLAIGLIMLCKKEMYLFIGLVLLPFTKLYFLVNFLIIFLKSFKKFILNLSLFLIIVIGGCLVYDENQFLVFSNLMTFAAKKTNMFELLNATSLTPIVNYSSIDILIILLKLFYIALLFRLYIFIDNILRIRDINLNDCKYLMFLLLLLTLIIIEGTGFYAIILLYPFFAYFISIGIVSLYEKLLLILISIPYPIKLLNYKYQEIPEINIVIQVHSLIIPILIIIIYINFTRTIRT